MHPKYTVDQDGDVCCQHGKAKILVSRTERNMNKKYYKCSQFLDTCLFKWVDQVDGVHGSGATPSASSSPMKRPREDEPSTPTSSKRTKASAAASTPEARLRRLETIQAALLTAGKSSQPGPSSSAQSTPSRSQQQPLPAPQDPSQSQNSQDASSSGAHDDTGFIEGAQLPSQPDDDDPFIDRGSPSSAHPHVSFNPLVKIERQSQSPGFSPSPSVTVRSRMSMSETSDDVLTPVREHIIGLERKIRALTQSAQAKDKRIRELEGDKTKLQEEVQGLSNDLKHEKRNVQLFQRLLSKEDL